MQKKRAITDLNAPNGSRDISFQSQEIGQDGHRHFVGFQPHFHLNITRHRRNTSRQWKNESGISQESSVWFVWIFAGCKNLAKNLRFISNFVAMATRIKIIVFC